jgi:predicted nucleic acid-binding protein
MDDRDCVMLAREHGLNVIGTLAVLELAAARGLLDLQTVFRRLRATTFRMPFQLMTSMLQHDAKRKKQLEPFFHRT